MRPDDFEKLVEEISDGETDAAPREYRDVKEPGGIDRRTFFATAAGSAAGAAATLAMGAGEAQAGDMLANVADPEAICATGPDFSQIPQRLHE